jgi:RNA polymerase sigma factor (sigma-70 family)
MVLMTARALMEAGPADGELARAAQAGDVASLGELLERYRAPLHASAMRMLGQGGAEDAVQETFVIALRRIGELRDPDAVGGWLHAVLRNVCLMALRQQRAFEPSGTPAATDGGADAEASVEEVIDGLALRDWVWTALSAMPSALQATAILRWFGGYPSYVEIAAILGVPVGTVRSRLNEAKRRLAEALLASAGLAHEGARRARERGVALYGGALDDVVRWETFVRTFADDVVVFRVGRGDRVHGRQAVSALVTAYPEAGVELRPTRVLSSGRVTVLEGRFVGPHPYGCPPDTAQVHFHRADGLTDRVWLYYARGREDQPGAESTR